MLVLDSEQVDMQMFTIEPGKSSQRVIQIEPEYLLKQILWGDVKINIEIKILLNFPQSIYKIQQSV